MAWLRNLKQTANSYHDAPCEGLKPKHRLRSVESTFVDPGALNKNLHATLVQNEKSTQLGKSHILLVGFAARDAESLREKFSIAGVASCNSVACLNDVDLSSGTITHVMVNADAFEDFGEAVDALLSYRKRDTNSAVILASSRIAADDLGSERRPICDVSLRFPLSLNRLVDGTLMASANNRELC